MGIDPDLMEGARKAVRNMIAWLADEHGLTREDAYILCSLAGDLRIHEIVDAGVWNVGMTLPLSVFEPVAGAASMSVEVREARFTWNGYETWYRVVGTLDGGSSRPRGHLPRRPGAAHDYTEPIAELSRFGRACVLYDQLGCGNSQHLPDAPAEFWTPQLFKDELVALTQHLGIAARHAVVGQSWGGMLAMEYALDHPQGLRGIVVADSPASMTALGVGGEPAPRGPPCRGAGDADAPRAGGHDRRPRVRGGGAGLLRPPPVPRVVAGLRAAQLRPDGRRPDRLPHDERPQRVPRHRLAEGLGHQRPPARDHDADPARLRPLRRGDAADRRPDPRAHPGAEWALFEESSHMPHVEEPEAFLRRVEDFLQTID